MLKYFKLRKKFIINFLNIIFDILYQFINYGKFKKFDEFPNNILILHIKKIFLIKVILLEINNNKLSIFKTHEQSYSRIFIIVKQNIGLIN